MNQQCQADSSYTSGTGRSDLQNKDCGVAPTALSPIRNGVSTKGRKVCNWTLILITEGCKHAAVLRRPSSQEYLIGLGC